MPRATPLPPEERRAAIIAATEPLLALHGPSVSTRQIAEAAGVAEGTLFRVFASKEALIDAVILELTDPGPSCRQFEAIDPALELAERLQIVVGVMQHRLRQVMTIFHAIAMAGRQPGWMEDAHQRQLEHNKLLNESIADVIEPDQDQLRVSPEEAAALLRSLTFSVTHPVISDQIHSEPEQVVQLLLYGITQTPHRPSTSPESTSPEKDD